MTATQRITRDDLERKFRELRGDVDETVEEAKGYAIGAAAVAVVLIAAIAFLMGRRRGKKKTTVVEIRRI